MLAAAGGVLGRYSEAVARMRHAVVRRRWIIVEDGIVPAGCTGGRPVGCEHHRSHADELGRAHRPR
jgi:hypothetical protein